MSREILIATLMRPKGETGVQTHFNAVLDYTAAQGRPSVQLVTSHDAPSMIVIPLFGLRRLVGLISSSVSVWWYRHWHARMLAWALRRHHSAAIRTIYAQCPPSACAALEVRGESSTAVVMAVHFNVSQADEFVEKGLIARDGGLFRAIRQCEDLTLSRLDGIVYVSRFMKETLERRIPVLTGIPSAVIPNFVMISGPVRNLPQPADLITIGTLEPRKNQAFLLRVLAAARVRGRSYSLTVVGDGPDLASLRSLAADLDLSSLVRFAGFQQDAARWIAGHRAYCHAATMESFGIVLVEALAQGVPVFAAPVGGIREVFDDGVEGRYWSLDDPEDAAAQLIETLESESILLPMKVAARHRYESAYAPHIGGKALMTFLAKCSRRVQ